MGFFVDQLVGVVYALVQIPLQWSSRNSRVCWNSQLLRSTMRVHWNIYTVRIGSSAVGKRVQKPEKVCVDRLFYCIDLACSACFQYLVQRSEHRFLSMVLCDGSVVLPRYGMRSTSTASAWSGALCAYFCRNSDHFVFDLVHSVSAKSVYR